MAAEPTSTSVAQPSWERIAPAGALGFLLTIVVGALLIGASTPSSQAPEPEIAAFFADHQSGMIANTVLVALGGFTLFPWWAPF